jgi:hypothetical protein
MTLALLVVGKMIAAALIVGAISLISSSNSSNAREVE